MTTTPGAFFRISLAVSWKYNKFIMSEPITRRTNLTKIILVNRKNTLHSYDSFLCYLYYAQNRSQGVKNIFFYSLLTDAIATSMKTLIIQGIEEKGTAEDRTWGKCKSSKRNTTYDIEEKGPLLHIFFHKCFLLVSPGKKNLSVFHLKFFFKKKVNSFIIQAVYPKMKSFKF